MPKLNKLFQAARSLGSAVTLCSIAVMRAAQAGRAALGMCLMMPLSTCGCEMTGGAGDAVVEREEAMTEEGEEEAAGEEVDAAPDC